MRDEDSPARAPQPWQPESRPRVLAMLGKLAEECNELAAICSRITIQGLDGIHPDDGRPNRAHLEDEIADVAALTGLTMSGVAWGQFSTWPLSRAFCDVPKDPLDYDRVERRRNAKKHFLLMWLEGLSHEPRAALKAEGRADG